MYRAIWGLLLMLLFVSASAQAQTSACQFTGALETLAIHRAPLTHPTQVKALLPTDRSYVVLSQHSEHFLIAVDDAYGGWADRRSGTLSGDCANIPVDSTPLSAFPSVCLFTADDTVPAFHDAGLTIPFGNIPAQSILPVVDQTGTAQYLLLDHATGAWVSADSGTLNGGCAARNAYALENARLWSQPDVHQGHVLVTLQPGSGLQIRGEAVTGPIRLDSNATGLWYPVQQGSQSGWVWAERMTFSNQNPANAITLENARLWSQPNVHNGQLLTTLTEDQSVTILSGPVTGPIRLDNPAQGDWYEVLAENISGWVWAERLVLP